MQGCATQTEAPLVLSGRDAILRAQPRLQRLAARCGQAGVADTVDYFLTQPYTGSKRPHLLLFGNSDADGLEGAVLVHQYRLLGVPLPLFVTEDDAGERNIIGPAHGRSALAVRAARYLLQSRGAHLVVLSLRDGSFHPAAAEAQCPGCRWAVRRRMLLRRLPLCDSYDATLATFGAHTRRNFRLFRRRALRAYGCTFVPEATLPEDEFLRLNALCDYPVPARVARWRFRSVHAVPGGVLAGVQTASGEWIGLVAGRRSHGTFVVDWQMNRTAYQHISPATLLRGYLMQHEAERGTQSLLFQGGTPHPMQSAFAPERVTDLVACAGTVPAALLRLLAGRIRRPENFLLGTLAAADLEWHAGMDA